MERGMRTPDYEAELARRLTVYQSIYDAALEPFGRRAPAPSLGVGANERLAPTLASWIFCEYIDAEQRIRTVAPPKGTTNNPRGRPPGIRGVTEHTLLFIAPADMKDSISFMRAVMRCPQASDTIRTRAGEALLRYENTPCTDRRISRPLDLPNSSTIEIALANAAEIKARVHRGEIGIIEGEALVRMEEATARMIQDTVLERDFRVIEGTVAAQTVVSKSVVSGGLPPLPRAPDDSPLVMPDLDPPPDPGPWGPPKDGEASRNEHACRSSTSS
jgi:hypothetical protein